MKSQNIQDNCFVRHGDLVTLQLKLKGNPTSSDSIADKYIGFSNIFYDKETPQLSAINSAENTFPGEFYTACIFQIDQGVGFDAPGEIVRYGSSIRLALRHTGQYLDSCLGESIGESFLRFTKCPKGARPRTFNFTLKSYYKIKNEGEKLR
jgi:hypothetical protein